jgi:CyaY protein
MEESEFHQRADAALESLCTRLANAADDFDFDVEMNAGALRVDFEEPPDRFVVSPNAPVRQIWVSAHVQSFKLDWTPARNAFVLPATGETLEEMMAGAIRKHIPDFSL